MSDFTVSPLGWSNRRKLAEVNSYSNADAERQAIRAERARIYAKQEEADRLALEAQTAALADEECRCPSCGGTGQVPVPKAAAMIAAWISYNSHSYWPSQKEVAALAAVARGDGTPPGCVAPSFSYGLYSPAPATSSPREEPTPSAPETVETPKPAKAAKVVTPSDAEFTSDGFLIEP